VAFAGCATKGSLLRVGASNLVLTSETLGSYWSLTNACFHERNMTDADVVKDDANACTCITLHRAKGLEYPIVFLPGLEEETLPHLRSMTDEAAIEEGRRLFYVGASRAKQRLYLIYARRRSIFGNEMPREVFRREPDPQVLGLHPLVQPPGKQLVLAIVADKTGVELDGLHRAQQRGQVLDQGIRGAATTQERLGNVASGCE
jgi:hypothetical protein